MFTFIISLCYPQYDTNGCITCKSHVPTESCGYCIPILSCSNECTNSSEFIKAKEYCSNEFCKSFSTKRDCKYPCSYSRIHGCMMNIDFQLHSSWLNIVSIVFTSIGLLIACTISTWKLVVMSINNKKEIKFIDTLDDIPSP